MASGGGFVALNQVNGIIKDCYSTGSVIGGSSPGGFAAVNSGTITDCFWDEETSGLLVSDGGTGELTVDMKLWTIFLVANWCDNVLGLYAIWNINPACNDGYPCLLNTTPSCPIVEVLTVETDLATNILAHGATMNGDLIDLGGELFAVVYFEYGLVSGGPYTDSTTMQVMLATGIFSAIVAHLQSETTYYFRAVANNTLTLVYGLELSFTTLKPTIMPPIITLGSLSNIGSEGLKIGSVLPPVVITLALVPETITLKVNIRT